MHQNYYSFYAKTHYEMGVAMGKKFALETRNALVQAKLKVNWLAKKHTALQMIGVSSHYFPHYIEELRGYADGAEVDFLDFWTISLEDDAFSAKNSNRAKCTTIITNNGSLIGHNEDYFAPGFKDTICVVRKKIGDFSTLEIFYYNTLGGSSIGVNSNGFVHAVNTLLYTTKQIGVPKSMIARCLLDTKDPEKDLLWLSSLERASGFSHLIADKLGHIWNAEFTSKTVEISQPSLPYCHTNHCLLKNTSASERDVYGTNSRLQFAQKHTQISMDEKTLQNLLSDNSLGLKKSVLNERTIGQMIVNQETHSAKVLLLREKELGWIDYQQLW
jgi:predicted choloylglycine hydrolase